MIKKRRSLRKTLLYYLDVTPQEEHVLLFTDQDRPGLIAHLAKLISKSGGNITQSEQYSSPEGLFFLRFVYEGQDLSAGIQQEFPNSRFSCRKKRQKRVALFLSGQRHCLSDLLWRSEEGQLDITVAAIISDKRAGEKDAQRFQIPFYHVPARKNRREEERDLLQALPQDLDFAILARYMRILSADFLTKAAIPFINVHHSFLPAFPGFDPYRQAYDRGVKVIGATAHYVIEELDAGAIISQKTAEVSHIHSLRDLKRIGQEQERLVLAEAVSAHSEDRVIEVNNKTVVFS